MADTAKKLIIPKSKLPPVNADFNAYFLRYRIVSEDKNLSSEWSAIHEVSTDKIYSASGNGSVVYDAKTKQVTVTWDLQDDISEYDVWTKRSGIGPALAPLNTYNIVNAVLDNTTGKITYTVGTLNPGIIGNLNPIIPGIHPYNVGDIVSVSGTFSTNPPPGFSSSFYNLNDYIVDEVPDKSTFVLTNKAYIGVNPATYVSGGTVIKQNWYYDGRVSGNSVSFYMSGLLYVFSVRVYVPHNPINHNTNYLVFAYLDKYTPPG